MNLNDLREEINKIDASMMQLFKERMNIAKSIGEFKKKNNLPVLDETREALMLKTYKEKFDNDELWLYYEKVLKTMIEVSRSYQND